MAQTPPLPKGAVYVDDPPLPKGATYVDSSAEKTPAAAAPETTLQKIGRGAQDFAKGVGEGALSTLSVADDWSRKHLPAFFTNSDFGFGPPADLDQLKELTRPTNTMQRIGKGTEQVGEFMLPTGLEEGAAKFGTEAFGKGTELAGRMAGSAVHTGAINKAQGGSFKEGAAAGATGPLIGAGLKRIAPVLAESALGVRGADRAYGATPGKAILEETKGFTPRKVLNTARKSMQEIQAEQGNVLGQAAQAGKHVDLSPVRNVGQDFYDKAVEENHPGTIKQLGNLKSQVETQFNPERKTLQETMEDVRDMHPDATGANVRKIAREFQAEDDANLALPRFVNPSKAGALNRGLSNAVTSWNPATATDTMNAAGKMMHHSLGESIAQVVPEIKPLNQRIQSLFPVIQRSTATDLSAGPLERMLGRFKAHTGALTAGVAGYHFGGVPGAVTALLGTEALASPETWLTAARAAYSPVTGKVVIPAASAAGLQFNRPKVFVDPEN